MSRKHNQNGAYALGLCAVCPRAGSNWGIRVWPGGGGCAGFGPAPARAHLTRVFVAGAGDQRGRHLCNQQAQLQSITPLHLELVIR